MSDYVKLIDFLFEQKNSQIIGSATMEQAVPFVTRIIDYAESRVVLYAKDLNTLYAADDVVKAAGFFLASRHGFLYIILQSEQTPLPDHYAVDQGGLIEKLVSKFGEAILSRVKIGYTAVAPDTNFAFMVGDGVSFRFEPGNDMSESYAAASNQSMGAKAEQLFIDLQAHATEVPFVYTLSPDQTESKSPTQSVPRAEKSTESAETKTSDILAALQSRCANIEVALADALFREAEYRKQLASREAKHLAPKLFFNWQGKTHRRHLHCVLSA